jgi:hypothetical protein
LLGKGIVCDFQIVPFSGGLGERVVAHHLDQVGAELAMKCQRGLRQPLAGKLLQPEMMPVSERRPVHILADQRAIHTLFAGHFRVGGGQRARPGQIEKLASREHRSMKPRMLNRHYPRTNMPAWTPAAGLEARPTSYPAGGAWSRS